MSGITAPFTAKSKSGKRRIDGSRTPALSAGWMNTTILGTSGKLPRVPSKRLSGKARTVSCWNEYMVEFIRSGLSADLVYARYGNSENGAERFAAQNYVEMMK